MNKRWSAKHIFKYAFRSINSLMLIKLNYDYTLKKQFRNPE